MPIINLKMTKEDGGTTKEQKEALIKGLTAAFVDVMGRGQKTTVVTIEEIETDNYGIGGIPVTEIRKSSS